MPTPRRTPTFPVAFHHAVDEDRAHASPAATDVYDSARRHLAADGLNPSQTLRCERGQARDGTDLTGCLKLYLPRDTGVERAHWGMVFAGTMDPDRGPLMWCLAFGERHPTRAGRPSVYQLAHRRLHHESS